jgi:hypothetical protein
VVEVAAVAGAALRGAANPVMAAAERTAVSFLFIWVVLLSSMPCSSIP